MSTLQHHDILREIVSHFEELAVRIEKLPRPKGEPALPYRNFRYGHRTPNHGPDAENKWRQPEYEEPPRHIEHPETL